MGTSRVSALPVHGDPDPVGAGGDGTGAEPQLADLQLRVAVQGIHPLQAIDFPISDDVESTTGRQLLSRLKDHSYRMLEKIETAELGQHEGGPEDYRRVRVVTACVTNAVAPGSVRHILDVLDRQCVDVTTEPDRRCLSGRADDVAGDTGS